MNRILFSSDELERILSPDDPRTRHMRKILNVEVGDTVEVGVIGGPRGTASILEIGDSGIRLSFDLDSEDDAELPFPVTMLLGHPRPIVLKRMLKDLTSLGVERILVAGTDLGEKSYLRSGVWTGSTVRKHLVEGAGQAGVTYIPPVSRLPDVASALDLLEETTRPTVEGWNLQLLAMDNQPFHAPLSGMTLQNTHVVLAVGSERGWSDRERIELRRRGFTLCSMGSRILRTETAAVCATAVVLAKLGI